MSHQSVKPFQDLEHPWIRAQEFKDITAPELFTIIKARAAAARLSKSPACLFDLDSTLFSVTRRIKNILLEFVRQHPKPDAPLHALLEHFSESNHRYNLGLSFEEILSTRMDPAPAKLIAEKYWAEFRAFWETHFFTDRHLHHDAAYPGAVDFVRALYENGFEILYLTGRDRPRSGVGTLNSLKQSRFPLGPRTRLFMKPSKDEADLAYKKKATSIINSQYEVLVTVDNEAENLVMFARDMPKSEIVFFHTVMSDRVPVDQISHYLGERKLYRLNSFLMNQ